ncbi:hypothetical protein OG613_38515 [Streptomyces sp. NBC_00015]|uniref:hypothetical protein n=1 Tax=unclassified Streptomyces TaxID=2593676 RepID=UPI0022575F7E|nr:hypothetical protein [Streptomyces sp. NBC_00103]MCX5373795.1 hypothetical protein [Streptomyces sp. NBC_00103]
MTRSVRWVVTVAVAVVVFGVCLWAGRSAPFGWMPKDEADRWVVATAFATVVATVAATAAGWWAAREQPAVAPPAERVVSQRATASGRGRVNQVGGDQNAPASPTAGAAGGPQRVEQEAEASDNGWISQVGGDQHSRPGTDDQQ